MMNAKEKRVNKLADMSPVKLVLVMALPLIMSQLVKALYNTVDSYFVSSLGVDEMAAITMAYSVQSIINAFAMGLGVGLNAVFSRYMGEERHEAARTALGNALTFAIILSICAMSFGLVGVRWYYQALGGTGAVVEHGVSYLTLCVGCSFGLIFSAIFESLLQATGHTISSMAVQGAGFGLNIILDPILIFGWFGFPKLGVLGAALATVLAQLTGLIIAVILNLYYNREKLPRFFHLFLQSAPVDDLLAVGIPSGLLNLLVPIMTIGMNSLLIHYSEEYVALFGIYFRVQLFLFLPIFGINNAIIPIVGFNYGAKKLNRVITTIRTGLLISLLYGCVGLIVFQLLGTDLLTIFNATENMLRQGVPAFKIISLTFPLAVFSVCLSGVFQGFGKGMFGLIINILRQLFVVLVAYVLVMVLGVDRIWYAYWVSENAAFLCCLFYGMPQLKRILNTRALCDNKL